MPLPGTADRKRHCAGGSGFRPTAGGINEISAWHSVHLQDRPQWTKPGAWTPAGRIGNPCLSKAVGRPWFGCVADSAQKWLVGSLPDAALEANLQAISGLAFRSQPVELRAVQLLNYESYKVE